MAILFMHWYCFHHLNKLEDLIMCKGGFVVTYSLLKEAQGYVSDHSDNRALLHLH